MSSVSANEMLPHLAVAHVSASRSATLWTLANRSRTATNLACSRNAFRQVDDVVVQVIRAGRRRYRQQLGPGRMYEYFAKAPDL